MPLPTCECVKGLPIGEQLSAIYCATKEVAESPSSQLTADELAAIQGADSPSAANPFLTAADAGPPTGSVIAFAGTVAPSGWLFCFGQVLSSATYPSLYAVIGETYGGGEGDFAIPDLRGRVIAGKDDMGGTSANRLTDQPGGVNGDTLGGSGGAETHTLSINEIPAHSHPLGVANSGEGPTSFATDGSSLSTINTQETGGSGAHNNVQPTFILNYIIKT